MKKALVTITLLGASLATANVMAANQTDVVSQASYLIGYHLAAGIKTQGIPVNEKQLIAGIEASMNNKPLESTQAEQENTMKVFQTIAKQKVEKHMQTLGDSNKQASTAFLAKMAKEPGVKELPDGNGVLYKVITMGKGKKPTADDAVEVNYEGTLIDGSVFDSSYKRGQPARFGVSQVIKGWTEALQQMPVGSTWMLYIPADMAYGESGTPGGPIPPNSALTFKVDLMAIK
jgi:FKBP-type peptidyl-prolyl cis-trans isomerase FklB